MAGNISSGLEALQDTSVAASSDAGVRLYSAVLKGDGMAHLAELMSYAAFLLKDGYPHCQPACAGRRPTCGARQ